MTTHNSPTSRWFRWAGVLTLIFGGTWFLVDGWTDVHVLPRQLTWAAITLALALSGVVAARRYDDRLGARLCLGLAAATLPLHFAQLGSAWFDLANHRMDSTSREVLDLAAVVCGAIAASLLAPTWSTACLAFAGGTLLSCALCHPRSPAQGFAWLGTAALLALSLSAWFALSPLLALVALALCGGYFTLAYSRRSVFGSVAHLLLGVNLLASVVVSLVRFPVSFGWLLPTILGISLLLVGSSLQRSSSWPRRVWAKLNTHFSLHV